MYTLIREHISFFIFFTSTDAPNLMLPFRIFGLIRCKDLELSMQQGKGNNQLKDITQIANCTGKFMNKAKYTFFRFLQDE